MRFLLIPENNSLSHIGKCLSVKDYLDKNGHETAIAVAEKNAGFLTKLGVGHHILPDIQETDSGGFPSFKWFSDPDTITRCIREEVGLIERLKPDRILGVFRFTLYASGQLTGVPCDSLICGCMIPDCEDALGFEEDEENARIQKQFLDNFFRFAGIKTSLALKKLGLDGIDDIRIALKGQRTYLWDFPEFLPIQKRPETYHVGPIALHHWDYDDSTPDGLLDSDRPIAVVSFGTCVTDHGTVLRIVRLLLDLGYKVIVAAGGQSEMLNLKLQDPRVAVLNFAPLDRIFPHASLLVTHGGQMTVFEALQNEVPVFVMPLQPEQAHNGVCLERIGCGSRLIPSTLFSGVPQDFIDTFRNLSDREIQDRIERVTGNRRTKENLRTLSESIKRYRGAETVARLLEGIPE